MVLPSESGCGWCGGDVADAAGGATLDGMLVFDGGVSSTVSSSGYSWDRFGDNSVVFPSGAGQEACVACFVVEGKQPLHQEPESRGR